MIVSEKCVKVRNVLLVHARHGRTGLHSQSVLYHAVVDRRLELGLVETVPIAREIILKIRRVINRNAHRGQNGPHMVNVQSLVVRETNLDRGSAIMETIVSDP